MTFTCAVLVWDWFIRSSEGCYCQPYLAEQRLDLALTAYLGLSRVHCGVLTADLLESSRSLVFEEVSRFRRRSTLVKFRDQAKLDGHSANASRVCPIAISRYRREARPHCPADWLGACDIVPMTGSQQCSDGLSVPGTESWTGCAPTPRVQTSQTLAHTIVRTCTVVIGKDGRGRSKDLQRLAFMSALDP